MSPLGLRGFSQLSCRESGLKAVKTSGPGALGVLRVNGEPSGIKVTQQEKMTDIAPLRERQKNSAESVPGMGESGLLGSTADSMVITPSLSGPQPS